MLTIKTTTADFSEIIEATRNILEGFDEGLFKLNSPIYLCTNDYEIDPVDLIGGGVPKPENPWTVARHRCS